MSIFRDLPVCREIAPNDYMYNMLPKEKKENYFESAADALEKLVSISQSAGEGFRKDASILDYGSGYGRITRYLSAYLGKKNVAACDIHFPAVKFCRKMLGVYSVEVHEPFNEIEFKRKFGWIFASSVFTHINASYWLQVLQLFERILKPGGNVMLTTAGRSVAELVNQGEFTDITAGAGRSMYSSFKHAGFGYAQYINSDKRGVDLGRCIVEPGWVIPFVERETRFKVRGFVERGFWNRQDAYLLKLAS